MKFSLVQILFKLFLLLRLFIIAIFCPQLPSPHFSLMYSQFAVWLLCIFLQFCFVLLIYSIIFFPNHSQVVPADIYFCFVSCRVRRILIIWVWASKLVPSIFFNLHVVGLRTLNGALPCCAYLLCCEPSLRLNILDMDICETVSAIRV